MVYDIVMLLATVGGLFSALYKIFSLCGNRLNKNILNEKIASNLIFVQAKRDEKVEGNYKIVRGSSIDQLK